MNGDYPDGEQKIRPSRWFYGLAGAIFVVGWVWVGGFLWMSLSAVGKRVQQVVIPGETEVNLPKPGKYTIFYEYETIVGERIYTSSREVPGLECSVLDKAMRSPVGLFAPKTKSTHLIGRRSGVSMWEFNIEHPGTYILSAHYPDREPGPEMVLAVAEDFRLFVFSVILACLFIVISGTGASVAIAVHTGVKRHRAIKAMEARASQT